MFLGSSMLTLLYKLAELGKIFQNLSVWSPDPVKILSPSGDLAMYSTR